MVDELRSCRRTACRWPAAASLSFRYETRQVWLEDLAAETNPARWDLCPHHADTLVVPRGWERVDRRSSPPAPTEPSWRERRRAATSSPPSPRPDSPGADALTAPRRNRYAALSAALPELAAALAAGGSSPMAGHGDAESGEASPGATVLPLDRWSSDRSASERGPEQN